MSDLPYLLVHCATSVDGLTDGASPRRLVVTNDAALDRTDQVRACADAILVGAGTVRRDDPRLLVKSSARQQARVADGKPANPVRVTVTAAGDLDPAANFFCSSGRNEPRPIVYGTSAVTAELTARLGDAAEVVDTGPRIDLRLLLTDLAARGLRSLVVEGGGHLVTTLLTEGLADELELIVVPYFIGDDRAPRLLRDGAYPQDSRHPMRLAGLERFGDLACFRYLVSDRARRRFDNPAVG